MIELNDKVQQWVKQKKEQFPELELFAFANQFYIQLTTIRLPKQLRRKGIGTAIIKELQTFNRPIRLQPYPEPKCKTKLIKFYKNLGFVQCKGKYRNYLFSSPFGPVMYWMPKTPNK